MSRPQILVRSRIRIDSVWHTEWVETTRSWRKAWSIVDDCLNLGEDRSSARKFQVTGGDWVIDIGGTEEHREKAAATAALLASVDALLNR